MVGPLVALVSAVCLALAGWALVFVVRDRAVILRQLWGGAVVEALLVVQLVVAAALISNATPAPDALLFWGYVATQLLVLPLAAAWAFAERTRWSSVVLLVAALTVGFLEYRLLQIWAGA